jgi:hypothetical protein
MIGQQSHDRHTMKKPFKKSQSFEFSSVDGRAKKRSLERVHVHTFSSIERCSLDVLTDFHAKDIHTSSDLLFSILTR